MGLIIESNAQYYSGQAITGPTGVPTSSFTFGYSETTKAGQSGFNTQLISAYDNAGNQIASASNFNIHNVTDGTVVPENQVFIEDSSTNIIDNFIVAYTGQDQILTNVKRSQVLFHAKRSLQELSYDTLPVLKSQELTIPPSLSVPIPQDYVNYVRVSWVDENGILHTINPLYGLSANPTELPIQDDNGVPTQNQFGENNEAQQSLTEERWKTANDNNITGNYDPFENQGVYDYIWWKQAYGQRYGLLPEISNVNGWFSINERTGQISFSSDLANKLIVVKYISDGLAYDKDSKIPKLAEEAMYMSIMYNIIASRRDVDGGTKAFYKREKYVKTRNAKIRLQNLKLDEIVQVFRGQSKWIKH